MENYEEILKRWEAELKKQKEQQKLEQELKKTEEEIQRYEKITEYYKNVVSPIRTLNYLLELGPLTKLQLQSKGFTEKQIKKLEEKKIFIRFHNTSTNLWYYRINGAALGNRRTG